MAELCVYQVDSHWRIVAANEHFCRELRASAAALLGRDVRDLIRHDWQSDFASYVAKALVRAGDDTLTLPMVTPRGGEKWFMHSLEAIVDGESVGGYRAWLVPHMPSRPQRWFRWRVASPRHVWNFDLVVKAP